MFKVLKKCLISHRWLDVSNQCFYKSGEKNTAAIFLEITSIQVTVIKWTFWLEHVCLEILYKFSNACKGVRWGVESIPMVWKGSKHDCTLKITTYSNEAQIRF